jgi:hypothetical protein
MGYQVIRNVGRIETKPSIQVLEIDAKGAIVLAKGNTIERPVGPTPGNNPEIPLTDGMLRYNLDLTLPEFSYWDLSDSQIHWSTLTPGDRLSYVKRLGDTMLGTPVVLNLKEVGTLNSWDFYVRDVNALLSKNFLSSPDILFVPTNYSLIANDEYEVEIGAQLDLQGNLVVL